MDDACLHGGGRERRADGVLKAGQAITAGDEDVLDASVTQVSGHAAPKPGAFAGGGTAFGGLGHPDAQHVLVTVGVDADGQVGGLVLHDVVVADLDDDRVQEHDRVDRIERTPLPGFDLLHHLLGDPRHRLGRQLGPIDLLQVMDDVTDAHPVRVKADDHVVQAARHPPGALGHQHRFEAARPVPRHRKLHRADPGLHPLLDTPVAGVTGVVAVAGVLDVPQMRGELGLQRPLQDRPDQLPEHRSLTGQPQPAGLIA